MFQELRYSRGQKLFQNIIFTYSSHHRVLEYLNRSIICQFLVIWRFGEQNLTVCFDFDQSFEIFGNGNEKYLNCSKMKRCQIDESQKSQNVL